MQTTASFVSLPIEITQQILGYLVEPHADATTIRLPPGEGINTAILRVNRQIYTLACQILKKSTFITPVQGPGAPYIGGLPRIGYLIIPLPALSRLPRIQFNISFSTLARGECSIALSSGDFVPNYYWPETIVLSLMHNRNLEIVHIDLLNWTVRKSGPARFKSEELLHQVWEMLLPFAYLPKRVKVTVGGFDTVAYVDDFEKTRRQCKGMSIPWSDDGEGRIEWKKGLKHREYDM